MKYLLKDTLNCWQFVAPGLESSLLADTRVFQSELEKLEWLVTGEEMTLVYILMGLKKLTVRAENYSAQALSPDWNGSIHEFWFFWLSGFDYFDLKKISLKS